jgi:hypothetical protein
MNIIKEVYKTVKNVQAVTYGLFNDAVSSSNCTASDDKMTNEQRTEKDTEKATVP